MTRHIIYTTIITKYNFYTKLQNDVCQIYFIVVLEYSVGFRFICISYYELLKFIGPNRVLKKVA